MALIDNLISYWKCDDSSGNIIDAHASNDGTNDGADYSAGGVINTSLDFEATETDSVNVGDIGDNMDEISISLWVRPESLSSSERQMFSKDHNTNGRSFILSQIENGKVNFAIFDNDNKEYKIKTNNIVLAVNTWAHILVTAKITTDSHNIYINGASVPTTNINVPWTGTVIKNSTANLLMGAREYSGAQQWVDGRLDEIGLWNDVLTSDDATALWNNGNGLAYPFTVGTNIKLNIGDVFKDVDSLQINIGDVWKDVIEVQQNIGDVWKTVF